MHSLIGPVDDGFAIFATAVDRHSYSVVSWPAVAGVAEDACISAAKLFKFLSTRWCTVERCGTSPRPDLFVCALTEEEVRQLTDPTGDEKYPYCPQRRAA
jgi:hypothetical protein